MLARSADIKLAMIDSAQERYPLKPGRFSSHSLLLQEFEDAGRGKQVLDVGCGRGHLARLLAERGYEVTGVDSDPESLEAAGSWCRQVVQANIETWQGFPGASYDYLLLADVLEHLRDPLTVLRRLLESVNDGGKVVLSVPNIAHLYVRAKLLFGSWDYADSGILDRDHLRFFTRASLGKFFDTCGLSVDNLQPTALPWSLVHNGALPGKLVRFLESIDHAASRLRPTFFAYQWVASGTKAGRPV